MPTEAPRHWCDLCGREWGQIPIRYAGQKFVICLVCERTTATWTNARIIDVIWKERCQVCAAECARYKYKTKKKSILLCRMCMTEDREISGNAGLK